MSFIRSALSPVVKAIATTKAPAAIGPYSQGMRASIGGMSLLYTSGALPLDPVSGKIVEGGIEKQTVSPNAGRKREGAEADGLGATWVPEPRTG